MLEGQGTGPCSRFRHRGSECRGSRWREPHELRGVARDVPEGPYFSGSPYWGERKERAVEP